MASNMQTGLAVVTKTFDKYDCVEAQFVKRPMTKVVLNPVQMADSSNPLHPSNYDQLVNHLLLEDEIYLEAEHRVGVASFAAPTIRGRGRVKDVKSLFGTIFDAAEKISIFFAGAALSKAPIGVKVGDFLRFNDEVEYVAWDQSLKGRNSSSSTGVAKVRHRAELVLLPPNMFNNEEDRSVRPNMGILSGTKDHFFCGNLGKVTFASEDVEEAVTAEQQRPGYRYKFAVVVCDPPSMDFWSKAEKIRPCPDQLFSFEREDPLAGSAGTQAGPDLGSVGNSDDSRPNTPEPTRPVFSTASEIDLDFGAPKGEEFAAPVYVQRAVPLNQGRKSPTEAATGTAPHHQVGTREELKEEIADMSFDQLLQLVEKNSASNSLSMTLTEDSQEYKSAVGPPPPGFDTSPLVPQSVGVGDRSFGTVIGNRPPGIPPSVLNRPPPDYKTVTSMRSASPPMVNLDRNANRTATGIKLVEVEPNRTASGVGPEVNKWLAEQTNPSSEESVYFSCNETANNAGKRQFSRKNGPKTENAGNFQQEGPSIGIQTVEVRVERGDIPERDFINAVLNEPKIMRVVLDDERLHGKFLALF